MGYQLDIEVAIATIRTAFSPYECDLRLYDHDRRIAFRVLDSAGNLLYSEAGIQLPDMLATEKLRAIVDRAREQISSKGRTLGPWTLTA